MYYNTGFAGHQIAMPPPLFPDGVTYGDDTPATVEQQARDVAAFLAWASEPNLEQRKRAGVMTILFLLVFTGLLYATKRKIWAAVHCPPAWQDLRRAREIGRASGGERVCQYV